MHYINVSLIFTFLQLSIIGSENRNHAPLLKASKKDPTYSSLKYKPCVREKESYCDHECIKCIHHQARDPYFREYTSQKHIVLRTKTIKRIYKVIFFTERYRQVVGLECEYQYPIERFFMYHTYVRPQHIHDFLVNNAITEKSVIKKLKKTWFGDWKFCITSASLNNQE